ncbi:hypothetical protein [Nocardioides sp. B-3]|uniref:hypothetical protein n=1 Tax=Nocardioides sp. B-3 TaxID=2895565 RepID=UPI002152AEA3|nr:hypothetical protein [Nocardioides sp. B-3]UUZ60544.1 hypothetical protein LP418_06650 [Nocardioides sp. B-3]
MWARVLTGEVDPSRARMIARSIAGRPRDVSDDLDVRVAPIAHKIGLTALEKKIDEAMLRLYPEQREAEQVEALDRRFVRLDEASINHTGIADMAIRADWKDLYDFDVTVSRVAAALATQNQRLGLPVESLDVRRARAIGILADPAAAHALLTGDDAPTPSKKTELVLHITDANLLGLDPVALQHHPRPGGPRPTGPGLVLTHRHPPHRPAGARPQRPRPDIRAPDQDPHPPPRRPDRPHLRVPTVHQTRPGLRPRPHRPVRPPRPHRRWCVVRLQHRPTVPAPPPAQDPRRVALHTTRDRHWLWSDPHGQQFLRDHDGTTDVTPTDRPPPGSGCRHRVNRQ